MNIFQASLELNPLILFGVMLFLGLIGGGITKFSNFVPRITGYIVIGYLAGPEMFKILDQAMLEKTRVFVDLSLSLILFELGRHLNFVWLRSDKGILPMAITESSITFSLVVIMLYVFADLSLILSLIGGAIAVATSPAITMMVAHDLGSEGSVTRRTLILTSLNNFFSITLFTILAPLTQFFLPKFTPGIILMNASYRLCGSIALGLVTFKLASLLARTIGKQENNQFILYVGVVLFTLGLAQMLGLSTMLALFVLGVAVSNFDHKHVFMEVDLRGFARLFFILFFVATGAYLQLKGFNQAVWATVIFLIIRFIGKAIGVGIFARASHLTVLQKRGLLLTLLPMGGVSLGMSNRLMDFNPDLVADLIPIIALAIAVLNMVGPLITQYVFIKLGEAGPVSLKNGEEQS